MFLYTVICLCIRICFYCIFFIDESSEESLLAARRASLSAELHFMYTAETTNTEELFSFDSKVQMGVGESVSER